MRDNDAEKRVTAAIVIACMVALLMLVTMFAVENRDIKQQLQKYQNQKIFHAVEKKYS